MIRISFEKVQENQTYEITHIFYTTSSGGIDPRPTPPRSFVGMIVGIIIGILFLLLILILIILLLIRQKKKQKALFYESSSSTASSQQAPVPQNTNFNVETVNFFDDNVEFYSTTNPTQNLLIFNDESEQTSDVFKAIEFEEEEDITF